MAINKKDVEHVARLARLALTDEEKENLTSQLSNILEYIEKLKELDTSNISPTSSPFSQKTVWRDDVSSSCKNTSDIIKNAPESEESFIKVRKVIE